MKIELSQRHPAVPEPADEGPLILQKERQRASFDPIQMSYALFGGKSETERRFALIHSIVSDPELSSDDRIFMNHSEMYNRSVRKAVHFVKKCKELGVAPGTPEWSWCYSAVGEVLPIDVHVSMFIPTIMNQTTPEQKEKWLPLALDFKITGAYAQTELGHGSNLRGLETTATYDREREEFIINSPTLTSTKWWPGGLGRTATHSIVLADLVIDGKSYGMHTFIVQLRSLVDHQPLPGITLGDIGPKFGFQTIDNGYARFNNVRVPRDQMLMRYAQVLPDGTYVTPPGHQMQYITMLYVRASIIRLAGLMLGKATTIAARYSAVRRQGAGPSGKELSVLDYQQQQAGLIPLIAIAYAGNFIGNKIFDKYLETINGLDRGDMSLLPEIHATSSVLKGIFSHLSSDGVEHCRRMCGGHGYSHASGLVELLGNTVASCTYEGTIDILAQQTARYLVKAVRNVKKGKPVTGGAAYLQNASLPAFKSKGQSVADYLSPEALIPIFHARAQRVVFRTVEKLSALESKATKRQQAWLDCQVDLVEASLAHGQAVAVLLFAEGVSAVNETSTRKVLQKLVALFGIELILRELGSFRDSDLLTSTQAVLIHEAKLELLRQLRPDVIALTDAWRFEDNAMKSCLGAYNGDVYRNLIKWVDREPLNQTPVASSYDTYLRGLLKKPYARL